jgi:hypothetical protein
VSRCTRERRPIRFDGRDIRNPLGSRRRDPEGFDMSLRAKVEVRINVAEIIQWIVIGYYLLT